HPDLTGRVLLGTSFVGGDPTIDPNGHGTALAGIAAAKVDNTIGIAGVAYNDAPVLPVQVLHADGTGLDADVVAGVLWAADNGAHVILMGFSSPDFSAALQDAVNYAWSKGAVLVAATGNDGSPAPVPGATPTPTPPPTPPTYVVGAAPTVQNVSSGAADGRYGIGQVIPITVTFDGAVTVTGTPQITLETGAIDAVVNFTSLSGNQKTLTFNYTVAAGQNSSDLDYVS